MRKPLPTRNVSKDVLRGLMKMSFLIITLVCLSFDLSYAQVTFGQTECDCLGNGSNATNGQFQDRIFIASQPGESWTLQSSVGFYDVNSPAPPNDPIPYAPGTEISYIGGGTYALDGIRQSGETWELVVFDGTTSYTINAVHTCTNPIQDVLGDMGACIDGVESYSIASNNDDVNNMFWTVTGGSILSGQGTNSIDVLWDAPVGDYEVSYTAQAAAYDGQFNNFCDISGSATVSVMDEEPFALACNNLVNISLNGQCDLNITADMILEDMMFTNSSYDLEFRDIDADTIVTGPTLGMEYINTTLEVKVIHECSGNLCWGYVLLEDKSVPPLECGDDVVIDCDELMGPDVTGFPIPDDATIIPLGNRTYLVQGFDKCSDLTLTYNDEPISSNLCEGPYSSIVERTWIATDNANNSTSCSTTISVNRATLDDIVFPDSYDDALGPNPSLEACGNWPKLPNGYPDPSFTGEPEGVFCLNVIVEYEDTKLSKCSDETFKIRRKWTVTDLCHTNGPLSKREHTQNITVADRVNPTCSAPQAYTVGTGNHDCSSIIDVLPPTVFDCSAWTYSVSYKAVVPGEDPFFQPSNEGVVQNGDGSYTITELPTHNGSVYILYYVEDECGNTSRCYTTISVEDDVQPIPVCDLYTFVAVGENGIAYAGLDAFDDGSWDNCGVDKIEVRRMGSFACGESVNWSDKVKFCCADIGNTVMVQLRVTDKAGNSNVCMVEAEVQDNHAPEITFCPADVTVDCEADISNLSQFGSATAIDNCNVTITETSSGSVNDCGVGTITRRFTATDDFGNTDVCTQRIRVQSLDPFYINPLNPNDASDDIIWPGNVLIEDGCADNSILPQNLPAGKREPQILREGCSMISYTYDDVVFQYVDEACLKILRKWTVIDDCVYSPFSNQGKWSYTQTIKIQNSTAPTFVAGCAASDLTITQLPNCRARVEASSLATDDCTDDANIVYSYKLDYDSNGSIDRSGNGRILNEIVEFGNHRITWEAEDECGNVETCFVNFSVADDKAPTPYCLSEIVTVIMAENGEVEIWASDFNAGAFDNCSDDDELVVTFQNGSQVMKLECSDLTATTQEFSLDIVFTDPSGNSDFCTAVLIVQDNQNVCGNLDGGGGSGQNRAVLGGSIYNESDQMLENVEMRLSADLPEFPLQSFTDGNGAYAFTDLLLDNDYMVKPASTDDYRNGVNTLDLVKIQRHLLGMEILDSPYKVIAADINSDEKISAADLLQLRKLILGVYTELPSNDSWRFVDAAHVFGDNLDPFPFTENVDMDALGADYMDADFVAVKIGDVDESASGFHTSNDDNTLSTTISTNEQLLAIGYNEITFTSDETEVYGMQVVLAINESLVSDLDITSDVFEINDNNVRYQNGKLYVSVSEALATDVSDELFTVKVTTSDEAYVSDILSLDVGGMSPQIISNNNASPTAVDFDLEIAGRSQDVEHDFELFQNVPNPFSTTTDISFVLPSDQNVSLTVMDITGKIIHAERGQYAKGYNVITLDISQIDASGILHYQLDTETNSDNKKMIIIK